MELLLTLAPFVVLIMLGIAVHIRAQRPRLELLLAQDGCPSPLSCDTTRGCYGACRQHP